MTPRTIAENIRSFLSMPDVVSRINELISTEEENNDYPKRIVIHDSVLTEKILNL